MKKHGGCVWLLALLSACVTASAPRPPLAPVLPRYTLIVHLYEGDPAADHKATDALLTLGDRTVRTGATGDAEFAGLLAGSYEVCGEAVGYVRGCATSPPMPPGNAELHLSLVRAFAPALQVRIDGRFFVTDTGTFRPIFQSGLTLLVRTPSERAAFLDQTAALGFNGVRLFAGDLGWAGQTPASARAMLPTLLDDAAARGLYVYVCAITGGRDPVYDIEAHLREVAAIVAAHANAILEVENEIGHPTLSDRGNDIPWLLSMARRVIPAGVVWTLGAPIGTDEPTPEGTYPTTGGRFQDAHLDRGRDLYNQVRRLREIENVSATQRTPAMSGEPIGIAEDPMPGRQRVWDEDALRFSFAYGALCRGFEIGCVWHSERGLQAHLLGPHSRAAAEAFIAGWRSIPTDERLTFVNAGWLGSPVAGADFDRGIVRAYSFTAGSRGWTVLVGVRGDPAVRSGGGWRQVGVVAERPGVRIVEIAR